MLLLVGCGATKNRVATEQMLVSDAVDRAIAHIDFSGLEGQKVYLNTKYIDHIRVNPAISQGPGNSAIINADYITSSIRQQMLAANVLVQDKQDEAEYIVELRCGAIGSDAHEVVYGMPANNFVSSAATLVPGAPSVPTIPELALAKRNDTFGAAKIGVFAYHRETKEPVWQAGIAQARSTSKDVWLFGAGPFQRGTIYDAPRFAGSKLRVPLIPRSQRQTERELVTYRAKEGFAQSKEHAAVTHETPAETSKKVEPPTPEPQLLPAG
ncbi:MAG TPA: DUF6655 family protein [Pirellulaceae bacterium]|nr:DUF6655 family protein [Pirellulaceae bacterium]